MGINKEEALKKINESDENSSFEVFTEPDHKTFLENFAKNEVSKRIDDEILKVHSQYDNDIFELTGLKREQNEKTYDFNKRIIKDLKEKSKGIPGMEEQIKKLQDDLKNNAGDDQLKKDYQALKEQVQKDRESWDEERKQFQSSQSTMQKEIIIDNALAQLDFKPDELVPKKLKELAIKDAKSELLKASEMRENKLIFLKDEKPVLNEQYEPKDAVEMLKESLSDILHEGRSTPKDFPSKKPEIKVDGDKKDISMYIPDTVKSLEDLSKHLMESGLDRNSEEYRIAYAKYSEPFRKKK